MIKHVSLFTGIGGIDLSAEWAGFETIAQVERDPYCIRVLEKHWPGVHREREIRDFPDGDYGSVTLVSGGDPCPIRSRARSIHGTKHPDLSGYFLAVVGRMRPKWVVRENVLASDDVDFEAALDCIGYYTVIIRTSAAPFTAQRRIRDFVVGSIKKTWPSKAIELFEFAGYGRHSKTFIKEGPVAPCLTAHHKRYDSRDGLVWEGRVRIIDTDERIKLSGFPDSWLEGLSESRIAKLTGNCCVPQQVYPILKAIADIEQGGESFGS